MSTYSQIVVIHVWFCMQRIAKKRRKKNENLNFLFTYSVIKNIKSKFIESISYTHKEYKYFRRRETVTLKILASYWMYIYMKKNQTYENNKTWSSRSLQTYRRFLCTRSLISFFSFHSISLYKHKVKFNNLGNTFSLFKMMKIILSFFNSKYRADLRLLADFRIQFFLFFSFFVSLYF